MCRSDFDLSAKYVQILLFLVIWVKLIVIAIAG